MRGLTGMEPNFIQKHIWPWSHIYRLRKAVQAADVGIFPKAVLGPGGYDKRSEFMEGWNQAQIKASKQMEVYLKDNDCLDTCIE